MKTQEDDFLKDIKSDSPILEDSHLSDLLGGPKASQKTEPIPKKEEEDDESPKNRRERRLEAKYQKERETSIALAERVKVLSELERFKQENPTIDPDEIKVFGTDENGKVLKSYFDRKFEEVRSTAKEEALAEIRKAETEAQKEVERNSQALDEAFERIEDTFNVDLSGKTKASKEFRNGYIDFVEKMSPKDSEGNIREYADFDSAYETYAQIAMNKKPREVSDRQKELGSRSMTHSGSAIPESPKGPVTFKSVNRMLENLRNQQ